MAFILVDLGKISWIADAKFESPLGSVWVDATGIPAASMPQIGYLATFVGGKWTFVQPKPTTPSPQDVTSWLGFTPYDASNPSGFQDQQQAADTAAATAAAAMKPKLGAITSSGHTTGPITVTTGAIVTSGTVITLTKIVDPISGVAPGVGAMCFFRPSGAADFPVTITVSCVCTAAGTVAVRVAPVGGIALGTMTLVGNVFWIW